LESIWAVPFDRGGGGGGEPTGLRFCDTAVVSGVKGGVRKDERESETKKILNQNDFLHWKIIEMCRITRFGAFKNDI